jgi:protein ImuB
MRIEKSTPIQLYACIRMPRMCEAAVAIARDFSPRLQRYGTACVVLDVSGLGRLLGEPPVIGTELARACAVHGAEPTFQVAVAPTQRAALLLAGSRPALTVITDNEARALREVPIVALQQLLAEIHGVTVLRSPRHTASARYAQAWDAIVRAFEVLRRWGLTTLGELGALPSDELSARLGQQGVTLQRWALGIDEQPLVPDPDIPRFLERIELEWPIDELEPLSFVLARMLEPLSASLERADRGAAAIRLDLRLVDRTTHTRVLQLPAAMRDAKVLRTLLLLDLESHPPAAGIDHVTIEVDPAPARIIQHLLLERARPSPETLATLLARLGALVGSSRCGTAALLDSHKPDTFEMRPFVEPSRQSAKRQFNPPPAIANPQSSSCSCALRRFRPPRAVRVSLDRGRPAHVAIDRRGMPGGRVEQAAGPWRSSGAWWDQAPAPHDTQRSWNRDEWDVAFSDGAVCRVFHERDTGRWFLDGVLD